MQLYDELLNGVLTIPISIMPSSRRSSTLNVFPSYNSNFTSGYFKTNSFILLFNRIVPDDETVPILSVPENPFFKSSISLTVESDKFNICEALSLNIFPASVNSI